MSRERGRKKVSNKPAKVWQDRYWTTTVDYLQRGKNEYPIPSGQSNLYCTRSVSLPEYIQVKDLLSNLPKVDPHLRLGRNARLGNQIS